MGKKKPKKPAPTGPVVIATVPAFKLVEGASAGIQHSRSIISETKSRSGNAFKTVKAAVTKSFMNRRTWNKILAKGELAAYLHRVKCMTDPKILDSRKKCVEKPLANMCHIVPAVLPRPLDKCELYDLAVTGGHVPPFYRGAPGLLSAIAKGGNPPPQWAEQRMMSQQTP